MLDLEEINNTIKELENADTTFDTCIKLSALYTVKSNLEQPPRNETENELDDILPAYRKYINAKREYQLNGGDESSMIKYMKLLCVEISEFLNSLYSGTSTENEREFIKSIFPII